jgi:hypothetical protein
MDANKSVIMLIQQVQHAWTGITGKADEAKLVRCIINNMLLDEQVGFFYRK